MTKGLANVLMAVAAAWLAQASAGAYPECVRMEAPTRGVAPVAAPAAATISPR